MNETLDEQLADLKGRIREMSPEEREQYLKVMSDPKLYEVIAKHVMRFLEDGPGGN